MLLMLSLLTFTYGCGSKDVKGTADSVFTVSYIGNISIAQPERALALLDSAEHDGLMSAFDINRMRAVVYHNGLSDDIKSLEYALKAYNSPGARENGRDFLFLLRMIADQYYLNGDYAKSIGICSEGITIARDSLIKDSEATLNMKLGMNLITLDRQEEGFGYFHKAIDILDEESKKDDTWEASDDYVYTVATLIGTLINEQHFDKATELLPRYDDAVKRLETKEQIPEGLVDMRRASGYGMAAQLYAINGEKDKAHEEYLKLCATDYARTPDAGQLIIPYLYQVGDYRGALQYIKKEKQFWQATTDTVSYGYVHNVLESELAIYEKLGDIREANRVFHTISELNDTLRARDRHDKALELAEIHKTHEQALQIEHQSASIVIRNVIIVSTVILLLFAAILITRILRSNRIIRNKNRAMVKTIDKLIGYKNELFECQEEVIQLRNKLSEQKEDNDSAVSNEAQSVESTETTENDEDILTNGDKALFRRMNHEIMSRRLFLSQDFSRKDLIAEFGISINKFSMLFKEFAGCTFSQYIQDCRLDYAVKLMRENPNWNFDAIAKEAQMSNGAFYKHFKRKFGMSPAEFKASEASISNED